MANTRWRNVKDDPFALLPPRDAQAPRVRTIGPTETIPVHPKLRITRLPAMVANGAYKTRSGGVTSRAELHTVSRAFFPG